MARRTRALIGLGGLLGFGCVALCAFYIQSSASRSRASVHEATDATTSPFTLAVPRAAGPITVDGHVDEQGWTVDSARTDTFLDDHGAPGRPYADMRLVWRDDTLYLTLYAGDSDIQSSDAGHDGPLWVRGDTFHLVFTNEGISYVFDVSPSCTVTDGRRLADGAVDDTWESGATLACDADGTVNDPSDEDEEWIVELAIPFASLGISPTKRDFELGARRCDATPSEVRTCTTWHERTLAHVVLTDSKK